MSQMSDQFKCHRPLVRNPVWCVCVSPYCTAQAGLTGGQHRREFINMDAILSVNTNNVVHINRVGSAVIQ